MPWIAVTSGEEALSWKIDWFRAIQTPQMWMRGRDFIWPSCGVLSQAFQASSSDGPDHKNLWFAFVCECFHTWVEKGQFINRWLDVSSLFLHKEHHPGPSMDLFFILSDVGVLLSRVHHMSIFAFRGHLSISAINKKRSEERQHPYLRPLLEGKKAKAEPFIRTMKEAADMQAKIHFMKE